MKLVNLHLQTSSSPSRLKTDPREEFKPFEYRDDLKTINDLKAGEWYPGIVTNITQFGAFVDIGIKENGSFISLKWQINLSPTL